MGNFDLFERLRQAVGCAYVSDLRFSPYRETAKREAGKLDLGAYPLPVLEDLTEYLYGGRRRFEDSAQAADFFRRGGAG